MSTISPKLSASMLPAFDMISIPCDPSNFNDLVGDTSLLSEKFDFKIFLDLIYRQLIHWNSLQLLARFSFQLRCQNWIFKCHASFTLHFEWFCSDFNRISINFKKRIAMNVCNSEYLRLNFESIMTEEQLIFRKTICISSIECDVFWWLCEKPEEKLFYSFLYDFFFVVFKVLSCGLLLKFIVYFNAQYKEKVLPNVIGWPCLDRKWEVLSSSKNIAWPSSWIPPSTTLSCPIPS